MSRQHRGDSSIFHINSAKLVTARDELRAQFISKNMTSSAEKKLFVSFLKGLLLLFGDTHYDILRSVFG